MKTASIAPALLLLSLNLTSCVSLKPIQDYGKATGVLVTTAAQAYDQFDNELSRARYTVASLDKTREVTPADFDGFLSQNDRRATREKMLVSLGAYAKSLEALASKDFGADIDTAVTDFSSNLNGLGESYQKLSGKTLPLEKSDIALFSTVVKVAADAYVESERKKAIRAIVPRADAAIKAACNVLEKEFISFGGVLEGLYTEQENALLDSFNKARPDMNPGEIVNFNEVLKANHEKILKVGPFYDSMAKAAAKVGDSHAALAKSVKSAEFTTGEFVSNTKQLITYVNEVRTIYDKLK